MNKSLAIVEAKIDERLEVGNDNAFYIVDVDDIREKVKYWREKMPLVEPFFAVKCNYNAAVLEAVNKLGLGFECASMGEVEKVLNLGVDPAKIIYSHTVKQLSHLKFCAEKGVKKMTFDSSAELERISEHHPDAEVFLRIRVDKTPHVDVASVKFGCDSEKEAVQLIKLCRDKKMKLIGINFHIGSISEGFEIYEKALREVSRLFNEASALGFQLNFVNIGGGFYGAKKELLDNYTSHINAGIKSLPLDRELMIVAEPGRYFVESAGVLATQIVLKRKSADGHLHYYINEGVFLSFFFNLVYNRTSPRFSIIRKASNNDRPPVEKLATVWGCSCHYIDRVIVNQKIPEMEIGDWIVFHDVGAYSECASTGFNGFKVGETFLCDSQNFN